MKGTINSKTWPTSCKCGQSLIPLDILADHHARADSTLDTSLERSMPAGGHPFKASYFDVSIICRCHSLAVSRLKRLRQPCLVLASYSESVCGDRRDEPRCSFSAEKRFSVMLVLLRLLLDVSVQIGEDGISQTSPVRPQGCS